MSPWGIDDFGYSNAAPGPGTVQRVLERASNNKAVEPFVLGPLKFYGFGDRVWVLEDEFKSGYECEACAGKGRVKCDYCGGAGVSPVNPEVECKGCRGDLLVTCAVCGGKGGTIIVPDNAQRRPTTGTIKSIGPGIWQNGVFVPTQFKVGDKILYSNFAGHELHIDGLTIKILHEAEIFGLMEGHLTLKQSASQREMPDSNDGLNNSMLDRGRT